MEKSCVNSQTANPSQMESGGLATFRVQQSCFLATQKAFSHEHVDVGHLVANSGSNGTTLIHPRVNPFFLRAFQAYTRNLQKRVILLFFLLSTGRDLKKLKTRCTRIRGTQRKGMPLDRARRRGEKNLRVHRK